MACSNFTVAVAWYTGTFWRASQRLNSMVATVVAMIHVRRRRTISQ